jgi:spectinomycin phosphotransferase/16S rRNA (guanine(1405)-N(7))-methyltransferase
VFTEPDDLPGAALAGALQDLWGFTPASLEYQPVGFGSHHWLATDLAGGRLYVTADDLAAKRRTAQDTTDDAFDRLRDAFGTASALRGEAGLDFVVAPLRTATAQVVARLSERYSLVAHPYVIGTDAGQDGEFADDGDRRAVLDMLIQIHRARVGKPRVDDFVVPHLDTLEAMTSDTGEPWCGGPYARRAQKLLRAHAKDLRVLIAAYRDLARRVAARPERMVITHGEPHAGNVIATADGLVLVDWDTALVAPPERDLWDLAGDDASLRGYYAAATGTEIDDGALSLYRLWFDLAEVGGYLSLFQAPHEDTADTRESWKELQRFLRPAERWPSLVGHSG